MSAPQEDLAAQYMLARRDFPDVDTHKLIEIIRERMGPAEELRLAQDMFGYMTDAETFEQIESFVWEMDTDPDDLDE